MNFWGWIEEWFDAPWRIVPAEPILFLFLWIGGVHVIATTDNNRIEFVDAGLSEYVYLAWNILILLSPIMVAVAWLLITFKAGRWMVFGFWLRLGGDTGILCALAALIATRIAVIEAPIGDSPLFGLITLGGFAVFIACLVVRDIGALVLLERLTSRLRRIHE